MEHKILELHKIHANRQHEWLSLWLTAVSIYTSIISAISAGVVASVFYFYSHPYFLVTLVGPILTGLLSILGAKTCARFYQRFLEDVTVTIKTEEELKLLHRTMDGTLTFQKDTEFFPSRWIKDRKKFKSSEEFIQSGLGKGINLYTRLIFICILLLSAVGFGVIIYIHHNSQSCHCC